MHRNEKVRFREVLKTHGARYEMEPADAIKLLYQSEFGGGHLISDREKARAYLEEEAEENPYSSEKWKESIGDGMIRVHLRGVDRENYPLDQLFLDFVRSSEARHGSLESFEEKLAVLEEAVKAGEFSFTQGELEAALSDYRERGYPMVSHSSSYREKYHPAYRIMEKRRCFAAFEDEILHLARHQDQVVVAIDGRCASGKSTLARYFRKKYGWSVLHMDDFFLRPVQRTPERFREPGGNVDYERFAEEVMLPLRRGELKWYRPFDCQVMKLGDPVRYRFSQVTVVEGSYSMHPALRDFMDVSAFLTIDPERQMQRIVIRNGMEKAEKFRTTWIPLEETYFQAYDVENVCNFSLELAEQPWA